MNRISSLVKDAVPKSKQYIKWLNREVRDPLHRNSIFLIFDAILLSGLGFFFWMVVARFYTEKEVGWAAAIISAISFLAFVSKLGFGAALVRFLPKAEKPVEMINSCLSLSALVSLAVALIFLAGIDIWSPSLAFIRDEFVFVLAFVVFAVLTGVAGLSDNVLIAKRRIDLLLIRDVIFCLLKIVLPFLMAIVFHSFGIVSSWGIALGIAVIVTIVLFFPRIQENYRPRIKLNLSIINKIWHYSSGNYFAALFGAAPRQLLALVVVNLHHLGPEQTAYFYVSWRIASLLFMIPTQASTSLFVEGSHFEDKLGANMRRSYKFTYLLLIPAIIFVLVCGKWLLLLFGGSYAENGLPLLRVLTLSAVFVAVNHIYFTILKVRGRIRELVVLRGFIALATLLGTYIITPTTGIIGVGYAWLVAQGLVSIYILLTMRLHRYRIVMSGSSGI